jgi:hypothetical protein
MGDTDKRRMETYQGKECACGLGGAVPVLASASSIVRKISRQLIGAPAAFVLGRGGAECCCWGW